MDKIILNNGIKIYIISYLLPCILSIIITFFLINKSIILIIFHLGLLINIFSIIQINKKYISNIILTKKGIFFYILSIILSTFIIGKLGIIYGISALIQELSILLTSNLLKFHKIKFIYIYFLTIIPFIISHNLDGIYKILLLGIWGYISLKLFFKGVNIFYIASLHSIFGSILIYFNLIYR